MPRTKVKGNKEERNKKVSRKEKGKIENVNQPTNTTTNTNQEYQEEHCNPELMIHKILRQMDDIHQPIHSQSTHFEIYLFIFLIAHLVIQNYNIYRMVCYLIILYRHLLFLPFIYQNFYNYNFYLFLLTVLILSKDLLEKYLHQMRRDNPFFTSAAPQLFFTVLIMIFITVNGVYFILQLFLEHSFQSFMYLIYP